MTPLTDLERKIVELVILGKSNREIAEDLGMAYNSVRVYMVPIFIKAKVNNRTELAIRYHRNQVIEELLTEAKNVANDGDDSCIDHYVHGWMTMPDWLQSQKDVLP